MEKKFECIHERSDNKEGKETFSYWYEPKNDIGGAVMQLKVTTTDPFSLSSGLGLPITIGGTVVLKTGKKESQSSLKATIKEDGK